MSEDIKYMDRIAALIIMYVRGTLSEREALELKVWCAQSGANQVLFDNLSDPEYVKDYIKNLPNIQSLKTAGRDRLDFGLDVTTDHAVPHLKDDVAFGGNKAELILSDGMLVLDDPEKGTIASQYNTIIEAYFEIGYTSSQSFEVRVGYMMWTCRYADAGQVV